MKRKSIKWERLFASSTSDRRLTTRIYKIVKETKKVEQISGGSGYKQRVFNRRNKSDQEMPPKWSSS